ncbi:MAG: DbpA RNA binding domain-containing protein [Spirochaetes bacterium]|nr:DbpA RNA binding domain-containing protein [Spirochaetota bacterium]MBU0955396.1 DbpA RNA binding domain-containing protein [Spirochaetota bacterium]
MVSKKPMSAEQRETLNKVLDSALADVRSTIDVAALDECRKIIRKKVPFMLRSWVMASLLMSALRGDNGGRDRFGRQKGRPELRQEREPKDTPRDQKESKRQKDKKDKAAGGPTVQANNGKSNSSPLENTAPRRQALERTANEQAVFSRENRYQGEGITLFVSAGRRQRFYARVALKLLEEVCGVKETAIGDIRTMDNYSFITIDPAVELAITDTLNGTPFKGRPLTVNLARKRDEAAEAELSDEADSRPYEDNLAAETAAETEDEAEIEDNSEY